MLTPGDAAHPRGTVFIDELHDQLRSDFDGTVYVVQRTEKGLDVSINIVDVTYYAILYKQGVKKVFIHHVAVDEERFTYTITDDQREVRWRGGADLSGGVPQIELAGAASRQLGTVKTFEKRQTWAWDEDLKFGKVEDYEFSSEDARRVVTMRAEELGLGRRMDTYSRIGLVMALIGGVGAAVVAVALGLFS